MDDDVTLESLEAELKAAKGGVEAETQEEVAAAEAKIKSPSLLEMGISKATLRSMGIHFRKEDDEAPVVSEHKVDKVTLGHV